MILELIALLVIPETSRRVEMPALAASVTLSLIILEPLSAEPALVVSRPTVRTLIVSLVIPETFPPLEKAVSLVSPTAYPALGLASAELAVMVSSPIMMEPIATLVTPETFQSMETLASLVLLVLSLVIFQLPHASLALAVSHLSLESLNAPSVLLEHPPAAAKPVRSASLALFHSTKAPASASLADPDMSPDSSTTFLPTAPSVLLEPTHPTEALVSLVLRELSLAMTELLSASLARAVMNPTPTTPTAPSVPLVHILRTDPPARDALPTP